MERKMVVSFTGQEFDGNVGDAVAAAKGFWPEMKKYGAVNMRATVTGKNTIGTMTLWSDPKCWKQVSLKLEPQLVLQLAFP